MLEVSQLTSGYGSMQVLWDISLSVKENEIQVVLGANGAGKSTFLKVAIGLLPLWSGDLKMNGTNIAPLAVAERVKHGLGYMSEQG
ncbi:branched-chain amino acid transport system ATP-binding protein, partial [mine drainage metagenome]